MRFPERLAGFPVPIPDNPPLTVKDRLEQLPTLIWAGSAGIVFSLALGVIVLAVIAIGVFVLGIGSMAFFAAIG